MIPFSIYTLIAVAVAFGGGFLLGKATGNGKMPKKNQQNAGRFADLEEVKEMGVKGRATIKARVVKRKARIMELVRSERKITNDDVEDLFCISDTTARNYLNELEAEGKLTQVGDSGRGVHYLPR